MDTYDLRRLQMLIRGLLLDHDEDRKGRPEPGLPAGDGPVRQAGVHSPVLTGLLVRVLARGGKTHSRYVGKTLPGEQE